MNRLNILVFILLYLGIMLCTSFLCYSQKNIISKSLNANQFPKGITYEGALKTAVTYADELGDHIVITTETGQHKSYKYEHYNPQEMDAELFAYSFLIQDNVATQTWRVYDYIASCNLDLGAYFLKNTFHITDLNQDGIAEIWLMYKTTCRGDTSPWNLKIIMYEGNRKYAMRGETRQYNGKTEDGKQLYYGGLYKYDKAFAESPIFLKFAQQLWENNCLEQWTEED